MEEIWKDIEGFEGLYSVSNLGRIKSFVSNRTNQGCGFIMKHRPDRDGYSRLEVRLNGYRKQICIHRVVALTFIKPIPGKTQVNHINFDKADNRVCNLEWCNNAENVNHALVNGRGVGKRGPGKKNYVRQFNISLK